MIGSCPGWILFWNCGEVKVIRFWIVRLQIRVTTKKLYCIFLVEASLVTCIFSLWEGQRPNILVCGILVTISFFFS